LAFHGVPLTANFELDEAAMLAAIAEHRPVITYLAYPNNPTANLWDDTVIENIVNAVGVLGGLVVMDEAYQPFASKSYIDRIGRHSHVLLMRTLSKFGLAGVRLGYMMGPRALIVFRDCGVFAPRSATAVEMPGVARGARPAATRLNARDQIGLKLCQHIVSLHGGQLRDEVEDGIHNFLIDLPTGAPHRSDAQSQVDTAQAQRYATDLAALMARARGVKPNH